MARKQTIAAFERWIAEEGNETVVLEALTKAPLHKVAVTVKQPYTCLYAYFNSSPERQARYVSAKEAWVEMRKGMLVEKVDVVEADKDQVARLKLESDIIDNQAKAYHRERWGERLQVEKSVSVVVDAGLVGAAEELLKLAQERRLPALTEKVVEALPVDVERS